MGKRDDWSDLPPLISTDFLDGKKDSRVIIVDIREKPEYKRGHIPGAINIPFSLWVTEKRGLMLELPDDKDLFQLIAKSGITNDSVAVVVNKTSDVHSLADAARVAVTLIYAGLHNVAILDGGHNKWLRDGRPLSKKTVKLNPTNFNAKVNRNIFVSKEYVLRKIGKATIIDARAPEVYFGVTAKPFNTKVSFSEKKGHIPTAKCLPTPWIWEEDGTYRSTSDLAGMVSGTVGNNKAKEVIIYCGVGGNTAAWWYILNRMLGYKNVKYFIGSAQEWTRDHTTPMVRFKWE